MTNGLKKIFRAMDEWLQYVLLDLFKPSVAKAIYGGVIDIIAWFRILWLFLTLPFVFIEKVWQNLTKKKTQ